MGCTCDVEDQFVFLSRVLALVGRATDAVWESSVEGLFVFLHYVS